MEDLISVIIPIYKVEAYLDRCVRSILSQSYQNLEIILVDDGSPDQCGKMCDDFAALDSRIRVFHKENGGLSDARNYGVEYANGKYIAFIDSDDYVESHYVEYLHDLIVSNDADIASCCMVKTEGDTAEYGPDDTMPPVQVLTGLEACYGLYGNLYMVLVTAWGKLYKQEIVKKYPFPKGKKHEDEATTCKYYFESQKVVVGNQCLYAYYQNPTSITHTDIGKLNEDKIWALEHKARFFQEHGQRKLAQSGWDVYVYFCVTDSLKYGGRCDPYLRAVDCGKNLSVRVRMELSLYKCSPALFRIYRRALRTLSTVKRIVRKSRYEK